MNRVGKLLVTVCSRNRMIHVNVKTFLDIFCKYRFLLRACLELPKSFSGPCVLNPPRIRRFKEQRVIDLICYYSGYQKIHILHVVMKLKYNLSL